MTELETYIRARAAQFDDREPAAGHGQRFLARLDAAAPASPKPARFAGFFRHRAACIRVCALAAACLAAFLLLRPAPGNYFRGVSDSPRDIYLAYMDGLARIYEQIPWELDLDWDAALQGMAEEGTPLFEQLPDELPARRKGRILKAYYGELLDGARQLTHKQRSDKL